MVWRRFEFVTTAAGRTPGLPGPGKIFNIGVYPYVEVQVEVFHRDDQPQQVVVFAENYGQRFAVIPENGWMG